MRRGDIVQVEAAEGTVPEASDARPPQALTRSPLSR